MSLKTVMLAEALWKEKVTHISYTIPRFLIASSRMEQVQGS